jgi:hypothetical protein
MPTVISIFNLFQQVRNRTPLIAAGPALRDSAQKRSGHGQRFYRQSEDFPMLHYLRIRFNVLRGSRPIPSPSEMSEFPTVAPLPSKHWPLYLSRPLQQKVSSAWPLRVLHAPLARRGMPGRPALFHF